MMEPRSSETPGTRSRATEAPDDDLDERDPEVATIARDPGDGRHAWVVGGLALALIGGAAASDPIAAIGVIVTIVGVLRWIAIDRGLRGVAVFRRLDRERVLCGDSVVLTMTVRNRDPLPIPWLRVGEPLPAELELALAGDPTTPNPGPLSGPMGP